jgi:hypothetical protein
MQDAYTTSEWFPYAEPLPGGGTNYIRNSVKVVIDAYNGSVEFYVADPADPVIATYWRIFPGLFKPFTAMPTDLQKHIRYPEDLFLIQAQLYRAYHMDAPEVFYNREDLWQFPRQPTGFYGVGDGDSGRMAPYYIIMRLPGDATIIVSASKEDDDGHWVKHKGKPAVHGFKAHVGADADTALVEEVAITPANINDGRAGPAALPDNPGEVFADSAYRGGHFRDAIHAKGGTPRIVATLLQRCW